VVERSVSIAEARARLPGLVRDAEDGTPVEITRWGRPVAILVSATKYQQMARGRPSFGSALDEFLKGLEMTEIGVERGEFEGLRDPGAGRRPRW
jgi:prevent-host-death family protein